MNASTPLASLPLLSYFDTCQNQFFFHWTEELPGCLWSRPATPYFNLPLEALSFSAYWQALLHPLDAPRFLAASTGEMESCAHYRFLLKEGGYTWMQCTLRPEHRGCSGILSPVVAGNDLDSVTHLRYISHFRKDLNAMCQKGQPFGILLLGIDDFKRINDLYSYSHGDLVLLNFAQRMQNSLPAAAQLFRLDGDRFGILYPEETVSTLIHHFENLHELAQIPVMTGEISLSFHITGAICHYPEDGIDGDTLYRNARITFEESKAKGKKQLTVCSETLCEGAHRRMLLLERLRDSVHRNFEGFSLRYQPLIHAQLETLRGCEVLMRWAHPDFPEGISPYEFIPILESSGLIFSVNRWLFQEAFAQCAKWVKIFPDFQMNVNVSCAQFEDENFKYQVLRDISAAEIPASSITLELTESGQGTNMETLSYVFNFLRSQGIKIAFDDFGTGYSSLSIFQMLGADELKIDRSFLQRLTYDVTDQSLVRHIIELCHSMNMLVCVEGVETTEMTDIVRQFGPELLQGFYYSMPLTPAEFDARYFPNGRPLSPEEILPRETEDSLVYAAPRPIKPMSMEEIINNAHAGIFQVAMDETFSFITCNEGYRRMLGYTMRDIEERFGNQALALVYPEDMEFVNQEIRRQLSQGDTLTAKFRMVRADGIPIWVIGTGNVVKSANGTASLVVIIVEIQPLKAQSFRSENAATPCTPIQQNPVPAPKAQASPSFKGAVKQPAAPDNQPQLDPLTGLLNKYGIKEKIDPLLLRLVAQPTAFPLALCVIDLDDFSAFNGEYGHFTGDRLLQELGARLCGIPQIQSAGRIGGDEFLICVTLEDPFSTAETLGDYLLQLLSQPVPLNHCQVTITASIGIALAPRDSLAFNSLLQLAHQALNRSKDNGKGQFQTAFLP